MALQRDYRDLVIEQLADDETAQREQILTLVDIIADLAFENAVLFQLFGRECVDRIFGDAALRRLRRRGHRGGAA